jgi:hypothetical protein
LHTISSRQVLTIAIQAPSSVRNTAAEIVYESAVYLVRRLHHPKAHDDVEVARHSVSK